MKKFQVKTSQRDKEDQFICIKGKIQEANTILNIYTLNTRKPHFIKEILLFLKPQINHQIVIVDDLNIPISKSIEQKLNRENLKLNDIKQVD